MNDSGESFQIPLVWVGVDDVAVVMANQFVSQASGPDEMIVTLGQMVPPALLGTAEEREQQARSLDFVRVRPLARLSMTPARMRELVQVMSITLENYEREMESRGDPR